MKALPGTAVWFAMAIQPVLGCAQEIHCEALGKAESAQSREGPFNPNNLLNIPVSSAEVGGLCDGAVGGWNWQVRAAARYQRDASADETLDREILLRQFYRSFDLDDQWSLTAGKKLRGWDVGYVAQPIDFLGDPKDSRDLEDRLSQRKASTFVALDHIGDDWTASLIVGENRLYADVRPQVLLTVERDFHGTNVQWITQRTSDQPWGAGGGVSTVFGKALELHGSFFGRRGTERPIHLSLINDDLRFYGPNGNPVSNFHLHDGEWYPRWVAGGQWTAESGFNVLLEWSHDERGLSPAQWRHLIALARFHAAGSNFGVPPAAVGGNIAFDAATLSRAGGSMQDYAFVRLAYPYRNLDTELYSLINAYDWSTASGVRLTYKASQHLHTWVDIRWNRGRSESEFAEVPVARNALLALRYFF